MEYEPSVSGGGNLRTSPAKDAPLTVILKDAADANIAAAERTYKTLHHLRDRLFGTAPTGLGSEATRAEPHCFAAAVSNQNAELGTLLKMVECMADELSSRL